MQLLPHVNVRLLTPQAVLAMLVARDVFARHGSPCVVTSCFRQNDPRLHGQGKAFDLRLPSKYGCTAETDKNVAIELRANLPEDYDVVLETEPQYLPVHPSWAPHIHVEYDAK